MSDIKEISPEVIDYSKKLQKNLKIEHTPGYTEATLVPEDKKYFVNHLEGDLTEASYKAHEKYKRIAVAGVSLAAGEMGVELMRKHPDLDKVSIEVPVVSGDKIKAVVHRSKLVSSFGGDQVEKLGHVSPGYEMRGVKGSVGDLSAVRQHIYGLAADKLSAKKK